MQFEHEESTTFMGGEHITQSFNGTHDHQEIQFRSHVQPVVNLGQTQPSNSIVLNPLISEEDATNAAIYLGN